MNYKNQIAIGFVLGMFALVMLSFKVSMDAMTNYEKQVQNTRFELIEKAQETMGMPVGNLAITKNGDLIINYDPDSILFKENE